MPALCVPGGTRQNGRTSVPQFAADATLLSASANSQLGQGGCPELRWECLSSRLLTINSRICFEQVFYEFAFPLLQNFHNFLTNSGLWVVSFLILPPLLISLFNVHYLLYQGIFVRKGN